MYTCKIRLATFNGTTLAGVGTRFSTQLAEGDSIVIKGMTYRVSRVNSDTSISILPAYRGVTNDRAVLTITRDVKIPRSQWNVDRCDGTGPSAYVLDVHKIQMAYIDYSWYGAGKVRFGFRGPTGDIIHCHELVHNNAMDEAYLRSGNLCARYEVENTGQPTYTPALMHWGTSVIMDGCFDPDKSYMYTAAGRTLSYANGDMATIADGSFTNFGRSSGTSPFTVFSPTDGANVSAYRLTFPRANVGANVAAGAAIASSLVPDTVLPADAKVVVVNYSGSLAYVFVDKQPLVSSVTAQAFLIGDATDLLVPRIPLQPSIRLAPSVDNNRPGPVGAREILNRMQLALDSIGVLTTHDVEIRLVLNGMSTNRAWMRPDSTSLSQLVLHGKGDALTGGAQIYTFRAAGGAADSTGKRGSASTTFELDELAVLGNAILGGDDVFPNGPDVLTVCASVLDTAGIASASPFAITARVSWQESQA